MESQWLNVTNTLYDKIAILSTWQAKPWAPFECELNWISYGSYPITSIMR